MNCLAMRKSRCISYYLLVFLHLAIALVCAGLTNARRNWKTLTGSQPLVIAHGGFSGIYPHSSSAAYDLALASSMSHLILWCDVQLTKDGVGVCLPDLKLQNSTQIIYRPKFRPRTHLVNGVLLGGYFTVDYTFKELSNELYLVQGIYSRTDRFDQNRFPILTVQAVAEKTIPKGIWLNVQHDEFYKQNNLSMSSFILSVSQTINISHISSPELGFLRTMASFYNQESSKLVFRFLQEDKVEPSTNQTYGSLLKNLTYVKTFASGILVPKGYVWPVDESLYLKPHTTLVLDAHREGLQVFTSDFSNDVPLSYNHSYDPLDEVLSFIDNGVFSVDGLLSDFPVTPSEAMDCFAHSEEEIRKAGNTIVISKHGASGDYPACSDLAYRKAISDGADVLDCQVQMSKDGVPFCFSSINLVNYTTIDPSSFSNLMSNIPEINIDSGIYTFTMAWNDIKTLSPIISNPFSKYRLWRNPKFKNEGKIISLSDFLALAKDQSSLSGVMLIIEHAAYLAEKKGLNVIDAVLDALTYAGYDNQMAQKVMIQSTSSSVLMKFKEKTDYELVYKVDRTFHGVLDSTVAYIKKFADAVVIKKSCVFPQNAAFLTTSTDVVPKLKSFNLSIYVETFSNEFVSQAWDYFSDATIEITSFVDGANVDGIITDFPKTSARYKKSRCLSMDRPPYMSALKPGDLMQNIAPGYKPAAVASLPVLTLSEVSESPLPSISKHVPFSVKAATFFSKIISFLTVPYALA